MVIAAQNTGLFDFKGRERRPPNEGKEKGKRGELIKSASHTRGVVERIGPSMGISVAVEELIV